MATLNTIITHAHVHGLPPLTNKSSAKSHNSKFNLSSQLFTKPESFSTGKRRNWVVVGAFTEDQEVAPVKPGHRKDKEKGFLVNGSQQFDAFSTFLPLLGEGDDDQDLDRLTSRAINAAIVLGFGTFAITKLFTIDHDYWQC